MYINDLPGERQPRSSSNGDPTPKRHGPLSYREAAEEVERRLGTLAETKLLEPYLKAMEEAERKQREEYRRDCANVDVLQTLEKKARTPIERVRWLERKVAAMPRIIQGHALIRVLIARRRAGRLSDAQLRAALMGVVHAFPEIREFPFPSGYAVGSVADEVAKARCELSRARWELLIWNRTGRVPGRLLGNLGEPASGVNKFDQCWEPQKRAIQAAFQNAQRAVNHAAAVLGTAYGRPSRMSNQTRQLLNKHFHTTDRDDVLEIFRTIFRIGQALEKGLNFKCETNCGGGGKCGYALATQWFGGFGKIHVCFDNRPGACSFTNLSAQEQAAAIIHETAHRHVGIGDKVYAWENPTNSSRDYSKLTSKQAMDNADSYAWFCVQV